MCVGETAYDDLGGAQVRRYQDEEPEDVPLRVQPGEVVLLQGQSVLGQTSRVEDRGYRLVPGA